MRQELYYRSGRMVEIQIDCDNRIIYNSILNCPLVIDSATYQWYTEHPSVSAEDMALFSEEENEVFDMLVSSFCYLPLGYDEYSICNPINSGYLEVFSRGKMFSCLDLRISEACNFKCHHCIANDANHSRLMSIETAKHCVDQYIRFQKEHNPEEKTITIHFGNCEPLLNYKVIKKVVEYSLLNYPEYSFEFSINTNLVLLQDEMAEFFIENDISIYTSLDGPREGNNAIRKYPNSAGTYDDIIKKMELLDRLGKPLKGISVTITDENYPYINEDFAWWCISKGFESVAFDFDLIHSTSVSNQEKATFLTRMWELYTNNNVEFYGTWMTPFLNLSNRTPASEAFSFCKAGRGMNISVDANGLIYACSYSSRNMTNFDSLWDSIQPNGTYYKMVKEHLSGQVSYRGCKGCELEGSCCGQCEMTRESALQKVVDNQCDYYRRVTKSILIAQAKLMLGNEKKTEQSQQDNLTKLDSAVEKDVQT